MATRGAEAVTEVERAVALPFDKVPGFVGPFQTSPPSLFNSEGCWVELDCPPRHRSSPFGFIRA